MKPPYELSFCNKLTIADQDGLGQESSQSTKHFGVHWLVSITVQGLQGPWLTSSSAPAIASRIRFSSHGLEQWAKFKDSNCIISLESPLKGRYDLSDLSYVIYPGYTLFLFFPWAGFKILMERCMMVYWVKNGIIPYSIASNWNACLTQ